MGSTDGSSPVACGGDKVYAAVHPGVWDPLLPVDVDFLLQVGFILVVNELHNGLPAESEGTRSYFSCWTGG